MSRGGRNRGYLSDEEKANRVKVSGHLLKRIGSYLKPYWKQMTLVFITIILTSVLRLLPSILTGRIIDDGLIGRDLDMLITLIVITLLVGLTANLIEIFESYLNTWIAQHITFDMRNQMFRHLQAMSHRFFTTNKQGDIITRMTSDISGVQQIMTNTLTSILSNTITLIVALIAMFSRNWILASIGLCIIPLFILPTKQVGKTRWTLTRDAQAYNDEINGILNETLSVSGQMLVKLYNKENFEFDRYQSLSKKMVKLNIKERMA
ncbi:MAG: ABC transporter, partial [Firmicutes bacterium HGW-Firmicutes-10]